MYVLKLQSQHIVLISNLLKLCFYKNKFYRKLIKVQFFNKIQILMSIIFFEQKLI